MKHPLTKPVEPTVAALIAAIRVVNHHHNLGDAVYNVRERHGADDGFDGDSWQHPKVIAYSVAVEQLRDMGALDPLPMDPKQAERAVLVNLIKSADFAAMSTTALQEIAAHLP